MSAVRGCVPSSLPLVPPIDVDDSCLSTAAPNAVGRLDEVTTILPSTPLFLFMYVRKEALLSSQIEGMQSSLPDLLLFENDELPQVPIDDVTEVSKHVAAIDHGMRRCAANVRSAPHLRPASKESRRNGSTVERGRP
ncbi:Fic/DOC family N-terminal domain-containing protein [Microvirga massiliensis]|uniref:Fic/DOC family N-terminal domain-containing protein n=1 Tax=Microvirga massiliensis TaxID=1033741 RepID=UPI0009E45615|nr:Fic/DOC family N-terminal domain-containing protein [Microvirga massiliensis]